MRKASMGTWKPLQRPIWVRACVTVGLIASVAGVSVSMPPDAQEILTRSDQARGGGLPGLVWTVRLQHSGTGSGSLLPLVVDVEAITTASIAVVREPASNRGFTMLQVERNMWLSKPGLSKPIPISPRQRLTGQVAVGDIAATNYAREYNATRAGEEEINGEICDVLELRARSHQATYDRIRYWVSKKRQVALRADFLTLSGKVIKSARFTYDHRIAGPFGPILFVSKMQIQDALTDVLSTLEYKDVVVRAIPAGRFDPGNL